MMLHFNSSCRDSSGFSLIELVIVLVIVGTLMSLTGGLVTKNIDKQARLIEVEKVKQVFLRLSYKAYYTGYDISVFLKGNEIIITHNNKQVIVPFEQLSFENMEYIVNTKAIISPNSFRVQWNQNYRDISLTSMFKAYE